MKFRLKVLIVLFLFLPVVFFTFFRLNTPLLWEDEGEVSVIARNINRFGWPLTYDGEFLVTQEGGQDSKLVNDKLFWGWNTWLPYYATAASFRVFGESTVAARLPFAIAGVLAFGVFLCLVRELFPGRKEVVVGAGVFLAMNPLFYLFVRNARYYAFTMLFTLLVYYFFFRYLTTRKRKFLWAWLAAMLANFHSNFVLSFGLPLPLIVYPFMLLALERQRFREWTLLTFSSLFLLQSFAWVTFFSPATPDGLAFGFYRYWGGLRRVFEKLIGHTNIINSFYLPLLLVVPYGIVQLWKHWRLKTINWKFMFVIAGMFTHLLVISYFLQFGQKYLLSLIPFFSLLMALPVIHFLRIRPFLGATIGLMLLTTNIGFIASERFLHPAFLTAPIQVRSYGLDYTRSLFVRQYKGPVEGVLQFFKERNLTQPVLYTDYEVDSLRFYLPHARFVNRTLSFGIDGKPRPSFEPGFLEETTFYIPRKFWGDLKHIGECEATLVRNEYIRHELPYYDLEWNFLPDITYHKFFLTSELPPLLIYERLENINFNTCLGAEAVN